MEGNGFDQFRVNLINEEIQFVYNQRLFLREQEDAKELDDETLYKFHDNRQLLDIILSKPKGLLNYIDLEMSGGNATSFLDAVKSGCPEKLIRVVDESTFTVCHYSGKVKYEAENFRERNPNFLSAELIQVIRESKNPSLVAMFTNKLTGSGNLTIAKAKIEGGLGLWKSAMAANHKEFNTESNGKYSQSRQMRTSSQFMRNSLLELLQKLSKGSAHFVRCIRSNLKSEPMGFDSALITYQIRALEVVESIRLRQNRYSRRLGFAEFLKRYMFLAFDHDEVVEPTRDNCRLLLIRLKLEGWALGKTKVLLKYYNEEYLSRLYEQRVHKIVKVQSLMRAFLARRKHKPRKSPSLSRQGTLPEGVYTAADVKVSPKSVEKLVHPTRLTANQNADPEIVEFEFKDSPIPSPREIKKRFEEKKDFPAMPVGGRCVPPLFTRKTKEQTQDDNKKIASQAAPPQALKAASPVQQTKPQAGNSMGAIIQAAARTSNTTTDMADPGGSSGPFNFQGMLRKTNRIQLLEEPRSRELVTELLTPQPRKLSHVEASTSGNEKAENSNRRHYFAQASHHLRNSAGRNRDPGRQAQGGRCSQNHKSIQRVVLSPGIVVNGFIEDL